MRYYNFSHYYTLFLAIYSSVLILKISSTEIIGVICAVQHENCECKNGRVSYETNYQILASIEVGDDILCSNSNFGVEKNKTCVHSFSPDCDRFCRCFSTDQTNFNNITTTVDLKTTTIPQTVQSVEILTTKTVPQTTENSENLTTIVSTFVENITTATIFTTPSLLINSTFEPIILTKIPTEISTTPYSKIVPETINEQEDDDSKFPVYLIVIIAISGLFLILFLLIFAYYCIKKKLDFKETGLFNSSLTRIGRKSRLNKIHHGAHFGTQNYVSTEIVDDIVYV